MSSMSGRDLARLLERHGWRLARVNGSHHIFVKEGSTVRISVPTHGHRALKRGLLSHLLKVAEIEPE